MRWRRAMAGGLFHSPVQKELVCIIPPSCTVMLGAHCPVYRPVCGPGFLRRMCSPGRRRIPRPPEQRRRRSGRRHHDSWSWLHRGQQHVSLVIIPLRRFAQTRKVEGSISINRIYPLSSACHGYSEQRVEHIYGLSISARSVKRIDGGMSFIVANAAIEVSSS